MTLRSAIGLACAVLASACGGASSNTTLTPAAPESAPAAKRECQAVDSAYALGSPVYTECGVERPARVRGRMPPLDFQPTPPIRNCYSAMIAVVVDERGSPLPATARIVRTSDSQFAHAILNAIPSWRFTPAQKDGMPVKQIVELEQAAVMTVVRSDRPTRPPPPRANC